MVKLILTMSLTLCFLASFSQWTRVPQLPSSDIFSLYQHHGTLYAGGKNKIYFSRDSGQTWDSTNIIPRFTSVDNIIVYKNELYTSSFKKGVSKSTDGGGSWQIINTGIVPEVSDFSEWRGELYASTLGASIFKLDPVSRSKWLSFSNGLSNLSANITSIAANSNALIAGTLSNGLYDYLPANTTTWEERFLLGRIRPTEGIYDIIAGHDSLFMAGSTGRFYMSTDNGFNWNTFGNILPSLHASLVNAKQALVLSRTIFDGVNFNTAYYHIKKDSFQRSFVNFSRVSAHFTYKLEIAGNRLWDASDTGLFYMPLSGLPGIDSVDDSATVALPDHFVLFNASCEGSNVLVSWRTTPERNNSRFDIEKSNDGTHWTVIGNLPSVDNGGSTETNYSFTDNHPSGNSYYRIAEHDFDGKVQYTYVLPSSCSATEIFSLRPNPVRDILFIDIATDNQSPAIIKLFDSKGALVKLQRSTILAGSNHLTLDLQSFANGVYQLSVEWNNGQTKKTKTILKL